MWPVSEAPASLEAAAINSESRPAERAQIDGHTCGRGQRTPEIDPLIGRAEFLRSLVRRHKPASQRMGNTTITIEHNKSKDEKFKAFCATCKCETNHVAVQTVDVSGSEMIRYGPGEHDRDSIDWSNRYQIIQCLGCDTFSFRHRNWFSEAQEYYGPDDSHDGTTTWLYPQRGNDVLSAKEFYNAPKNLRTIYKEIINCFNNDSPVLCAAGLRAAIEGLCAAHGVVDGPIEFQKPDGTVEARRKGTLEGKISGLFEKGLLTKHHADVLHEHRYMGNEAVHELSRPSDEDLGIAIEIVEHTFDALYELPEKAEALRANRAKRSKP